MFKKFPRLVGKKAAGKLCHPAYKSFMIFKLSNCPKILHLNVSGLKIGNPTSFMTPFPFQPSISSYDHLKWLTRSRDTVMQRAYWQCIPMHQIRSTVSFSTSIVTPNWKKRYRLERINHVLYDPMVFWEAGEPALILRHQAHHKGADKIKLKDIQSKVSLRPLS